MWIVDVAKKGTFILKMSKIINANAIEYSKSVILYRHHYR